MANISNNNNLPDEELDLARIYGVDDSMDGSKQNLEDLIGYNLNETMWNRPINSNENVKNDMSNMQMNNSNENNQQNTVRTESNEMRQNEQRINPIMPTPQRQEQSMPTSREIQRNMQFDNNGLENMQSIGNIDTFLRTQIGKKVRMQFLIGTNTLIEKSGMLMAVGDNFVVLRESGSGELLICDFDDVKFIRLEDNVE